MSTVLGLAAGEHTPAGSRVSIGQSSLEALHVFAVAQVLRRPLIVYADDRRSAESGDGMSGIYLPSLISPEEVRQGCDYVKVRDVRVDVCSTCRPSDQLDVPSLSLTLFPY